MSLEVRELFMVASHRYTADEQMRRLADYWSRLHGGLPAPLTVRVLSPERDFYLDLAGGNRIPKAMEHQARSVEELRAAGVGVHRVLLLHDGSAADAELFEAVLTMLDPQVKLGLLPLSAGDAGMMKREQEQARKLGRPLTVVQLSPPDGPAVVERLRADQYDLIILPMAGVAAGVVPRTLDERTQYVLLHAPCRVFLAAPAVG